MRSDLFYYLFIPEVLLAAVLLVVFYPPTYVPINNTIHEFRVNVDDQEKDVKTVLAWKQNSIKVKKVFVLFPTSRELVFYSEVDELEIAPSEEFLKSVGNQYDDAFNEPVWKYYLFIIFATIIGATYLGFYVIDEIMDEKERWQRTLEEDSFPAYTRYLIFSFLFPLHKKKARKRIREKGNEFKVFVNALTGEKTPPGDNILLKIIDYVAKTGDHTINLKLKSTDETEEVIPFLKSKIKEFTCDLDSGSLSPEETDELNEGIVFCKNSLNLKFHKVKPFFKKENYKKREKGLIQLIDKCFRLMFGDYVVDVEEKSSKKGMVLQIDYKIRPNPAGTWYEKGNNIPENERVHYPFFTLLWDIVFTIDSKELLREEIDTFYCGSVSWYNKEGSYYDMYMLRSFGDFALDFMKSFGFERKEEIEQRDDILKEDELLGELKEINSEIKDQLKENAMDDVGLIAKNVYERNSNSINLLLNGFPKEIELFVQNYSETINKSTQICETASEFIDLMEDDNH